MLFKHNMYNKIYAYTGLLVIVRYVEQEQKRRYDRELIYPIYVALIGRKNQ